MLPPKMKALKQALDAKGFSKRTSDEDKVLEELNEIDTSLDKAKAKDKTLTENMEKRVYGAVGGVGVCPMCGK